MNSSSDNIGFTKVEKVVEKVLIQNKRQDLLYFTRIFRHWNVIVGDPLAKRCAPSKLQKGVLYVQVEDSAYSHTLRFYEKKIIDLIASPEICGENVVRKIVFRVGPKRMEMSISQEVPTVQRETETQLNQEKFAELYESETSRRVSDKALRRAFTRCMTLVKTKRSTDSHQNASSSRENHIE